MMTNNDDGMDIPAFLLVANRGKVNAPAAKCKASKVAPRAAVDPIAEIGLAPETEMLLRNEIKCHRFMPHWLDDPGTLFVFERENQLRKVKAEKKAEDKAVERKIARNERESMKREFGIDQKIIVLIREPRRQPGAARIPRFASLLEYLAKHPDASVAEIFKNTLYIKSDFMRDQRLKIIKTDIISKAPAAKKGK